VRRYGPGAGVIAFIAGVALSVLSSLWAMACAGRRPARAAITEGLWAWAIAVGVGAAGGSRVALVGFVLGCTLGTYFTVRWLS